MQLKIDGENMNMRMTTTGGNMKIMAALFIVTATVALVAGQSSAGQGGSAKPPAALVITTEQPTVKAGSMVAITVHFTNTSKQPIDAGGTFNDATGLDSNFLFDVRDDKGHLAAKRAYRHPELWSGHAILDRVVKPDETLSEEQDISRLYDMTKPGKYVIQASRAIPKEMGGGVVKSNSVSVTVTP
jgi:hypothetical protein